MTDLTAVSLFAGVGGFDLAMERQGINVVAAVEIDKNARGVLQNRFPNTKIFNDVTTVTGEDLLNAGFIPNRGIITGGFPCQDLSVAGKRAGLAGKRSGLYWEIIRLVDELTPAYLVLENVPGLLSSNGGRDMGTVIGALSTRGYGVSWRVLDAQYFGVAQRRRRVFIVASLGDGERSSKILALSEGLSGNPPKGRKKGQEPSTATGTGTAPSLLTMREGSAGGGVVPTLNAFDNGDTRATVIVFDTGSHGDGIRMSEEVVPTLQARMGTGGNNTPMVTYPIQGSQIGRTENNGPQGSGFGDEGAPMFILNTTDRHAIAKPATVRRLTPTECERLQGFPDGWTEGQADSHRYKQMGNAVAVPVVEWIMSRLVEVDRG